MQELTKNTEKALKILYCEYKRLSKAGFSESDAMEFCGNDIYKLPAFSDWLHQNITTAIEELHKAEFVFENVLGEVKLLPKGIKYMQNKPKEYFEDISKMFDIISIFKP